MKEFAIVGTSLAFLFSAPASADDWTLRCDYRGGLQVYVNYLSGDPSYNIYVATSGDSDLGRGQRFAMNNLMTPDETVMFTQTDGDVQIIFRVSNDSLDSQIEIGSQVSWDYRFISGRCEVANSL